jgi:hypothetical protein
MIELEPKKKNNSSLERLLKENIELNEKIYESCQKTERYIHFIRAFGIVKFILVVIPIVIGALYVIPLLGGFFDMYKDLFTSAGEATGLLETMKDIQGFQ